MPATPDDLFAFLDRLQIKHRTVSHPAAFTVAESRHLHEQIPGGHSKNLFLKDKRGYKEWLYSELERDRPTLFVPSHGKSIRGADVTDQLRAATEAA